MIVFLHAALFAVLSSFSLCYISLLHAYFHLRFGLHLLILSVVCSHLAFFPRRAPLSFSSHGPTTSIVFCHFRARLRYSCLSIVFISDLIPPCHSAHPSQHHHVIYFLSCFFTLVRIPNSLSFRNKVRNVLGFTCRLKCSLHFKFITTVETNIQNCIASVTGVVCVIRHTFTLIISIRK